MKQNAFDISKYFTMTCTDSAQEELGFTISWNGTSASNSLEYCWNGSNNWINGGQTFELNLARGQSVSFRGGCSPILVDDKMSYGMLGASLDPEGEYYSLNKGIGTFKYRPNTLATTNKTNVLHLSGNIMSLLYGNKSDYVKNTSSYTTLYGYDFLDFLFPADASDDPTYNTAWFIRTYLYAHDLVLPSLVVKRYSYAWMFSHLFATAITSYCTLSTVPALPATTLAEGCYMGMFMFHDRFTTAPDLLAKNVPIGAYSMMFVDCHNLNYIKMTATNIESMDENTLGSLYDWVEDVAASGTFVKSASLSLPTGVNGIPSGWTVQNV